MIPGLGRSPGGGNGNPLQYSLLENPMDRGAWRATVHRVAELDITEQLSTHTCTRVQEAGREQEAPQRSPGLIYPMGELRSGVGRPSQVTWHICKKSSESTREVHSQKNPVVSTSECQLLISHLDHSGHLPQSPCRYSNLRLLHHFSSPPGKESNWAWLSKSFLHCSVCCRQSPRSL